MNKKANLWGVIMLFVLVAFLAVTIALTSYSINVIQSTQETNSTLVWNVSQKVAIGFSNFASLFPPLMVLIFGVIIVVILVSYFAKYARRKV